MTPTASIPCDIHPSTLRMKLAGVTDSRAAAHLCPCDARERLAIPGRHCHLDGVLQRPRSARNHFWRLSVAPIPDEKTVPVHIRVHIRLTGELQNKEAGS
ncbi:hypothetical protein WOLCODRAFT_21992 [Wolfiporia cocos MD-104 SS10]|uniref:Uncharacterized protein n=1 Tax=Wolfiporia cocos (strain MD-104) TaxID=742152 RepID=A0A2H3ITV0_WOLCO|nr:hypothetical protein WOLCODRAFT_21992 [Wolfiporia cocos MD-104 SS10]